MSTRTAIYRLEVLAGVGVPEVVFHLVQRHVRDVIVDAAAELLELVDVGIEWILQGVLRCWDVSPLLHTSMTDVK